MVFSFNSEILTTHQNQYYFCCRYTFTTVIIVLQGVNIYNLFSIFKESAEEESDDDMGFGLFD